MQIAQRHYSHGSHVIPCRAESPGSVPYIIGGRRMYVLGVASGALAPLGEEHLRGLMGGVWAHPLRLADGVLVAIEDAASVASPASEAAFEDRPDGVTWAWRSGNLALGRDDSVAADAPVLTLRLSVTNESADQWRGMVRLVARLRFTGAWFAGLHAGNAQYTVHNGVVSGTDDANIGWGLACGSPVVPADVALIAAGVATDAVFGYALDLAPGEQFTLTWQLAGGHSGGAAAAEALLGTRYAPIVTDGSPQIVADDEGLTRDVAIAQANLVLLSAEYAGVGAHFLGGLPEFPNLFGCDTAYSVPGALIAGHGATMRAALLTLTRYARAGCGRVPHEIVPGGRVFHPGNVQETPQHAIACWDFVRWSGDLAFLREVYPVCREGMAELLPAIAGLPFPIGDGMVERFGMGPRKLDSAAYAAAGFRALGDMAAALGDAEADAHHAQAIRIAAALERDWWIAGAEQYGDSMHLNGTLQHDGHWTQVVPLQLGITSPERATRVLDNLVDNYVNEWGLVHTQLREERVWTLPTGLLALAAFAHGKSDLGLQLTRNIAVTAQHGTPGTFKELIPQGMCFIQLWSAAIYMQLVVEGILGIRPLAHLHTVVVTPSIPAGIGDLTMRGLQIGEHTVDVEISGTTMHLIHRSGPCALAVRGAAGAQVVEIGERVVVAA